MRKTAVCLTGLFLVLASAGSASASLVAHYTLDETSGTTVADSSGHGYDGTLIGGASWVAGTIDGALELNGSSGYADFGNPVGWPSGTAARTLCGWARTDSVSSTWKWIAAYGSEGTGLAMFIGLNGTSLYGGGYGDDLYVSGFWETGVWHHICLTYDGMVARLYADGVERTSAGKNWNLVPGRAHIGQQVNNYAEFWDGTVDDVRLYDHALTAAEVKALIPVKPRARNPEPANGATGVLSPVLLRWTSGDTAKWHKVYLGMSPDLTEADLKKEALPRTTVFYYHAAGFESGATYYWRVDEIEADGVTIHTGDVWQFTVAPLKAFHPAPADGARFQRLDVALSWTGGTGSASYDVYFGTDEAAVAAGTGETFRINQTATTYDVTGLTAGALYFWRVDGVRSDKTKLPGDVWSFSTVPDIAIANPDLLGWWTFDEQEGLTAVDWSGHGTHGTLNGNVKWVDGAVGGALDFDGDGDYVDFGNPADWPVGAEARTMCGWAKTDSIAAEWKWIAAYGSPNNTQAMFIGLNGAALYGGGYGDDLSVDGFWETDVWHHIALTYDGGTARLYADGVEVATAAKTWDLVPLRAHVGRQVNTAAEFWDGVIDDVRIYRGALTLEQIREAMRGDPALAYDPQPEAGAEVDIRGAEALSWSAGDGAAEHDVYLGSDREAVKAADANSPLYQGRQAGTSFATDGLVEFGGGSYFWRIDELEADGLTVHTGAVWGFTVPDYLIVDDFESYTDDIDAAQTLWHTWIDGLTNGTGSYVGYQDARNGTFGETTIVHSGDQSMPIEYKNADSPYYSEVEREFEFAQDWTDYGVDTLSLWFRGNPVAYVQTGADSFKMSAVGADIWNASDECRFACKQLNGNGSITARIDSLANTGGWAKAGVMIRQSLDASSKHAAAGDYAEQRCFIPPYRAYAADVSYQTGQAGLQVPYWVRLTRTGDLFKAEYSPDGGTWTQLGAEQTISMVGMAYIGLCLSSYNPTTATVAEYSNVATTGGVTGVWEVAEIGVDHPGNDADELYVALEDSNGKKAIVVHPDPEAVLTPEWTPWPIPLSRFAGMSLARVKKICIGVGDSKNPTPDGTGRIYIDSIHLTKP